MLLATSTEMISLLLQHGANPNKKDPRTGKTIFDHFLEFMPEGCEAILNHFIVLNGSSFQGSDLKVTLDFKIVHDQSDEREMKILNQIVLADKIDLLKHPICESFLQLKWLQVKKYFFAYFGIYLLFLVSFNVMVCLDLSHLVKGKIIRYLEKIKTLLLHSRH